MSTIKCPHCGKELPSESAFCPYCMEQIKEPVAVSVPKVQKSKSTLVAVVITIAMLLLVVVLLLLRFCSSEGKKNKIPAETASTTQSSFATDGSSTTEAPLGITDVEPLVNIDPSEHSGDGATTSQSDKPDTTEGPIEPEPSTDRVSPQGGGNTTSQPPESVCNHSWVALKETVHYDEVGHFEEVERSRPITMYRCPMCYKNHYSLNLYYTHFDTIHVPSYPGDPIGMFRDQYTTNIEYENYTEEIWVVDREAYDEEVLTGYKCSKCGKLR